jgi:hypothetical protein
VAGLKVGEYQLIAPPWLGVTSVPASDGDFSGFGIG